MDWPASLLPPIFSILPAPAVIPQHRPDCIYSLRRTAGIPGQSFQGGDVQRDGHGETWDEPPDITLELSAELQQFLAVSQTHRLARKCEGEEGGEVISPWLSQRSGLETRKEARIWAKVEKEEGGRIE